MPRPPPISRLSTKKNSTPPNTTAQAIRSSLLGRLCQNSRENTMTKIGAVNWSTMVLAAVVSLLATAYSRLVPNTHTAPRKIQRFILGGCLVAARNAPITTRAMAVRPPLMAIPLQGITLMHSPPMLYSTAAMKTNSTPVRRSTSIASSNPPKRKLGQTENPLPGFSGQRAFDANAVPPLVRPPLAVAGLTEFSKTPTR